VVATLSAQDADGDVVKYSLSSDSPFAIVGNSLVLARALDFESVRQHSVTVQARDDYQGVATQTFTFAVTNAVETTPYVLRGGSGADVLQGEAGNDTIYGGAGKDSLSGDAGQDTFVFDTRTGSSNVDAINDFVTRDDSIWLDNAVFKALGSKGSLAKPQKLGSDAFVSATRAQDKEDRIVYDKKSGKLYYDQDGAGGQAQVQIATLSKNLKMTASDFFVI
jgi:Ca2+-binding RTX toxin-like protein